MSSETEQPLYGLELSYSREDYERFLKFYHKVIKKSQVAYVVYIIMAMVFGLVVTAVLDNVAIFFAFVLIGVLIDVIIYISQWRGDQQFIEKDIRLMPTVYTFYADQMSIRKKDCARVVIKYHDLFMIYELKDYFYIMTDRDTVAIIPKDQCPDGLKDLILDMDRIKSEWLESEEGKAVSTGKKKR